MALVLNEDQKIGLEADGIPQFAPENDPTFDLMISASGDLGSSSPGEGEISAGNSKIKVKVLKGEEKIDNPPQIKPDSGTNNFEITVDKEKLTPGKYKLEIRVTTPTLSQVMTQDPHLSRIVRQRWLRPVHCWLTPPSAGLAHGTSSEP